MAKIQLTPTELMAQSTEMNDLKIQYEGLFQNVKSILKNVNENWSENLSNNFSGKIVSAQNGFSKIVSALQTGSEVAQKSADTFQSVDSQLAKVTGAEREAAFGSGSGGGGFRQSGNAEDSKNKSIVDWFINDMKDGVKSSQESLDWIEKHYNDLPEWLRKDIEMALGEDATGAIEITADIVQGEVGLDDLGSFLKMAGMNNNKVSAVTKTFDMVWNKTGKFGELERGREYLEDLAMEDMLKGDYGSGILHFTESCGMGLFNIVYGSTEVLSEIGIDIVEGYTDKVLAVTNTIAHILPGDTGANAVKLTEGVESVTNTILQGFRDFL